MFIIITSVRFRFVHFHMIFCIFNSFIKAIEIECSTTYRVEIHFDVKFPVAIHARKDLKILSEKRMF